jgi:hypothetical protein
MTNFDYVVIYPLKYRRVLLQSAAYLDKLTEDGNKVLNVDKKEYLQNVFVRIAKDK